MMLSHVFTAGGIIFVVLVDSIKTNALVIMRLGRLKCRNHRFNG